MARKKRDVRSENDRGADEFKALRERLPRVVSRSETSGGITFTVTKVERTVTLPELDQELRDDKAYPDPEDESWE